MSGPWCYHCGEKMCLSYRGALVHPSLWLGFLCWLVKVR